MDLDHGLATQPAHDWSRPVAAWSEADPADALDRLDAHLAANRMAAIAPIDLHMTQAFFGEGPCTYLAETRALRLAHPCPFPRLDLFRRSRRRAT